MNTRTFHPDVRAELKIAAVRRAHALRDAALDAAFASIAQGWRGGWVRLRQVLAFHHKPASLTHR